MPSDKSVTINDAILHAEVLAAVPHQFVEFFEGALVEQKINPLARGKFAFFMLAFSSFSAAASSARA